MTNIYKVKNYKIKPDNPKNITKGTKKEILALLEHDKGYHQLLTDDTRYNLFFELVAIPTEKNYIIHEFIAVISDMFQIDGSDIKFTISKKGNNNASYIITIPLYNANITIQAQIAEQLKETFENINISIYQNNGLVRLPNQTNEDRPTAHKIINGSMNDFILDAIQPRAEHIEHYPLTITKKISPVVKTTHATDEQLKQMLFLLDKSYLEKYDKWIIITNIFKGLGKGEIWDEWSKMSNKYNKHNNFSIWCSTKRIIYDVVYLSKLSNLKLFKIYNPIIYPRKMKHINRKYLYDTNDTNPMFSYDDFLNNNSIVIQSCTGTAKTTATAEHISTYIKENNFNVLSIISRITLGDQHIKSFNDKGIKLFSYKNGMHKNTHFVVCINSLLMLKGLSNEELSKYIVFIDEINSFIEHITHNEKLHHELKQIYSLLIRIIKHAHKVITADALISDNVFTLLKTRGEDKQIFIKNDFKKYEGIKANRLRDENDFKLELQKRITNNEPFLFGCDSCAIVEEYFYYFFDKAENKDKFILFTANHKFNITDASEQFKDKFVFFSPAITTAIDFSIDIKQDVFIYIKGNSILPSASFQQTTRTRNIKELFYFCSRTPQEPKFNSLEQVKEQYNKMSIQHDILTEMSLYIDEDDNAIMSQNSFFNLFCYNEYVKDIYETDKLSHYENILSENKFILKARGKGSKIDKELRAEMADLRTDIDEEFFNAFMNDTNRMDDKYKILNERIELLGLPADDEIINKYKSYLASPHAIQNHLNVIRLFKADKYINAKVLMMNEKNYKVKQFYDVYAKISILRGLQGKHQLTLDNLNYKEIEAIIMTDGEWEHIKKIFRYTGDKPTNKAELKPIIIKIIKSITDDKIIESKQVMINKIKQRQYSFNKAYLDEHLILDAYSNSKRLNYDAKFNSLLDIKAFEPDSGTYLGNLDNDIFQDSDDDDEGF